MMILDADGVSILVNLLFGVIFGAICASIANNRGRSGVGWFFIGFFTSCIGLVLVLVLPDLKSEQARDQRMKKENRMLREQVKAHRNVLDRRHAEISRRLGVHDDALAIDTREDEPGLLGAGPLGEGATVAWHWVQDGEQEGPIDETELASMFRDGSVDGQTYVWTSSMGEWQRIDDLPDLRRRLGEAE